MTINNLKFADIGDWLNWSLTNRILSPTSQQIFDKYYYSYREVLPNYVRNHYQSQTSEVMAFVYPGVKVLEVGCGCGTESLWFALNGASVVGTDLREDRLIVAQERCEYIKKNIMPIAAEFKCENIFNLLPPKDDGFDVIWMEQAFHHIEPREQLSGKLNSLLKPGGCIVISESNAYNLLLQLRLFKQRGTKTIVKYTDKDGHNHVYGNERITTAGAISKIFAKQGFETISTRYFRILPNFKGVDYFEWIDKIIPQKISPLFTHFNTVIKKPM